MASALIKAVRNLKNLERAWSVIHRNGRFSKSDDVRKELMRFAEDTSSNLLSIKSRLGHNSFKFAPAKGIPIPKTDVQGTKTGKFRPIVLAPVESRIVQRAILNVLLEVPNLKRFIKTPYSFGGIKGEHTSNNDKRVRSEFVSAVPGAIEAVLKEINAGAKFIASADIKSFFTHISKDKVTSIIEQAVDDSEFVLLFRHAIDVELSNMAQLREKSREFPIEDIGVAQGNSLSPLLGNIILANFDMEMNKGDCRCIRYIDDFLILAPSKAAATARLEKAIVLLRTLGMELSPEKSSKGGVSIDDGFNFLGINICRGAIRPSLKAQHKLLRSIKANFDDSAKAMRGIKYNQPFSSTNSLSSTLKRIDGMVDGWGKHYWFCNDDQTFVNLDRRVSDLVRAYIGTYTIIRRDTPSASHQRLMGISELQSIVREPFKFPATGKRRADRDSRFAATPSLTRPLDNEIIQSNQS